MINRDRKIDIAKGLGIILVVLGHGWFVHEQGELFRIIFSFHMPLFFLLSGVLINTNKSIRAFALDRADALLKPYFVVLILFGLLKTISSKYLQQGDVFDHANYFFGLMYATGNTIVWVALWFLPHLFITSLFSFSIIKTMKLNALGSLWLLAAAFGLLLLGVVYIQFFWAPEVLSGPKLTGVSGLPGLPWSVDLVPVTAAFFIFGYLLNNKIKAMSFNAVQFIASVLIFSVCHYLYDETMDLNLRVYGDPIISSLQVVSGIFLLFNLALLLDKFDYPARLIAYIGSASIFILLFHIFIQGKSFVLLSETGVSPFLGGLLSLVLGIFVPILLLKITKMTPMLALLMLPNRQHHQHKA